MPEVLVLGAGRVARPAVRSLLAVPDIKVTVASQFLHEAEALIAGKANGCAIKILAEDKESINTLVSRSDLVMSLLPPMYHLQIARICIHNRVPLVTTSYTSQAMWALDKQARDNGVLILMEIGEDPGLDHMSVKRLIDKIRKEGVYIDLSCLHNSNSFRTEGCLQALQGKWQKNKI